MTPWNLITTKRRITEVQGFLNTRMSQENTQMSVENKYNRDSGVYFTAGVVVKLMILGVIFFAVAIAGFIASTANCTVRHEGTWVNTCQFESRASWAVGTGATVAGVVFTIAGCYGFWKRDAADKKKPVIHLFKELWMILLYVTIIFIIIIILS
nr:uncharacterized protein LOC113813488 [Penaeus vannamei]